MPHMNADGHPRQCVARSNTTGERCKKWAIHGGKVCPTHGGSVKRVKKSAKQRLIAAAEPAISKLIALLDSKEEAIAIKAALAVLDRTGYHPKSAMELTGEGGGPIQIEGGIVVEFLSEKTIRMIVEDMRKAEEEGRTVEIDKGMSYLPPYEGGDNDNDDDDEYYLLNAVSIIPDLEKARRYFRV